MPNKPLKPIPTAMQSIPLQPTPLNPNANTGQPNISLDPAIGKIIIKLISSPEGQKIIDNLSKTMPELEGLKVKGKR